MASWSGFSRTWFLKIKSISLLCNENRYTDPVDGSHTSKQGLILFFEFPNGDAARVVFRLSGTGSSGATIRMYLEKYEKDVAKHNMSAPIALKMLADRAIGLVKMEELTGRRSPTVITWIINNYHSIIYKKKSSSPCSPLLNGQLRSIKVVMSVV